MDAALRLYCSYRLKVAFLMVRLILFFSLWYEKGTIVANHGGLISAWVNLYYNALIKYIAKTKQYKITIEFKILMIIVVPIMFFKCPRNFSMTIELLGILLFRH